MRLLDERIDRFERIGGHGSQDGGIIMLSI